jgi:subtilisin family serine protease
VNDHIVIKLHQPLPDDLAIPDWHHFIGDKSIAYEQVEPGIDRVMREHGLSFWLTREYAPAGSTWSDDERRHGLDRTYRLILQTSAQLPPGLVEEIRALPAVERAHGIDVVEAPLPELATETSIVGPSPGEQIYLEYAKALTKGTPAIRVAVVDTGADMAHPELEGKFVEHANFVDLKGLDTREFIGHFSGADDDVTDEVGHGTHVSGIIGARGLRMDEGVAPDCSLVAIRCLATMMRDGRRIGAGIVDNINRALKHGVDTSGAHVINVSLGIKAVGAALPHADVIRYALGRGVSVVAASGNDGSPERYYPGALPGVFAVGAATATGTVATFSSYGAPITCLAPGTNIYSSFADHGYAVASGTSQASPFVAGSVALMKSFAHEQGLRLSNASIAELLERTSDKVDSQLHNERAGYGLLNLADGFKFLVHSLN